MQFKWVYKNDELLISNEGYSFFKTRGPSPTRGWSVIYFIIDADISYLLQVTLGPKGRNALLDQSFGAPKITKVS